VTLRITIRTYVTHARNGEKIKRIVLASPRLLTRTCCNNVQSPLIYCLLHPVVTMLRERLDTWSRVKWPCRLFHLQLKDTNIPMERSRVVLMAQMYYGLLGGRPEFDSCRGDELLSPFRSGEQGRFLSHGYCKVSFLGVEGRSVEVTAYFRCRNDECFEIFWWERCSFSLHCWSRTLDLLRIPVRLPSAWGKGNILHFCLIYEPTPNTMYTRFI
jgi:hypothetical protein